MCESLCSHRKAYIRIYKDVLLSSPRVRSVRTRYFYEVTALSSNAAKTPKNVFQSTWGYMRKRVQERVCLLEILWHLIVVSS